MYSKFTSITPKEAALWLDTKNSNNRPISQSTVDRYVQEIKAGRWRSNGQAIIFNRSGNLAIIKLYTLLAGEMTAEEATTMLLGITPTPKHLSVKRMDS